MKKLIRKVHIFATITATFAATVAPAIIRADFVPPAAGVQNQASEAAASLYLRVTAYSSTPDQTDNTPFITANGTHVRDGIVATNMLPFGTKIEIPSLFGDKIFTVEDRMAKRMKDVVDVWMASKNAALKFGVSYAKIVVIADKALSQK